jgi:hypothetical protein
MGQAIELVNGGDPAAAKKKLGISAKTMWGWVKTHYCHMFWGINIY